VALHCVFDIWELAGTWGRGGGGSENLSRNSKPHFACWLTHWPNRELLNICALKPTVQGLNLRNIQNAINGAPQWVETTANGPKKSKRSKKVHKSPQKTQKVQKNTITSRKILGNSRKHPIFFGIFDGDWTHCMALCALVSLKLTMKLFLFLPAREHSVLRRVLLLIWLLLFFFLFLGTHYYSN
jgi:hypothetical protein